MRRVAFNEEVGRPCLWSNCTNDATHVVINVVGEIEGSGCEFHAHQFKKHQDDHASRKTHPSTPN